MAHLKRRFLPAWLFSAPFTSTFLLNRHSHPYAHQQYLYVKYASVTRLGDLLHFGQLFKACGINYFAQIALNLGNFCKVVKIFQLAWEIIFGQLLWTFGDFLLVTLFAFLIQVGQSYKLSTIVNYDTSVQCGNTRYNSTQFDIVEERFKNSSNWPII